MIYSIPRNSGSSALHVAAAGAVFILALLCLPTAGRTQNAQGTILGHISDPSGQAVASAKVTIQNTETGVKTPAGTNGPGDYVVVNLIPGTYQVSVEASGFAASQANGLLLEVE